MSDRRDKMGEYADFMDDVIFFMHQTRDRMLDMNKRLDRMEEIVEDLAKLPKSRVKEEPL
jgi:hypothetical protein